jgi:hypothetical protein
MKVPSTVLRGKGGSDPAGLPGILAADSFRLNSGDFQSRLIRAVSSDAAKSADDLVMCKKKLL